MGPWTSCAALKVAYLTVQVWKFHMDFIEGVSQVPGECWPTDYRKR